MYMRYGADGRNFCGSFIVLLNSFQMKSMIEKGLPPGMTRARRLQEKYLSAVASPSLASMVAQKN
jgi:hypothetical protein